MILNQKRFSSEKQGQIKEGAKKEQITVEGIIVIRRYSQNGVGEWGPLWHVECGNCGAGGHDGELWGCLGDQSTYSQYDSASRRCKNCDAIYVYYPARHHWSFTKFNKTYWG